jgi:predicted Zn-dependent protease
LRVIAVLWLTVLLATAQDTPRALFDRAAAALAARDYDAAERGFRAVLKAEPANVGALGNLGVVYSRTHRYADAVAVYQQELRHAPADFGLRLNLGLAHVNQERYLDARPIFEKLAAAQPANPQVRELLATCMIHTGDPGKALELLEPPQGAAAIYLTGLAYSRLKQPEKAQAALDALFSAATPAQANFLAGKAHYDAGRLEEAAEAFRRVIAADRAFPLVHLELGKAYISLRRNQEAEQELRLSLQADGGPGETHYFLGGLLAQQKRDDEAVPHLESALRMMPDAWGACYYLGRIRLTQGKLGESRRLLELAARLSPREAAIQYQLAQVYRRAGLASKAQEALSRTKQLQAGKLDQEIDIVSGRR